MAKNKKQQYFCSISGKPIPPERVEALITMGVPQDRWTCVEHSIEKPRKGIFLGENGTSEMLIVDKVYDDSVRSVFRSSKRDAAESEESDTDYDDKELSYYTSNEEQVDPEEKIEIIKRQTP